MLVGKHWNLEQVRDYFAPSDEALEAVKKWLTDFGIESEAIGHSDDRAWVAVNLPVKQAEELMGAEYYEHEVMDDSVRIGCDE